MLPSAPKRIHRKGGDLFCDECRAKWERSKLEQCRYCRMPMLDCRCSSFLMRRNGNNVLLKLCSYSGEHADTVKSFIYTLKRGADRRAELFAAHQLHSVILKYASVYLGADLCITNVPRRNEGNVKYGYDHAELLARNISKISHIPYISLLERVKDGKEQKNLSETERCKNVEGVFSLTPAAADVKGKCVIIADDVVTTGASMNECIAVLKTAEPAAVLPVCIAQTAKIFTER